MAISMLGLFAEDLEARALVQADQLEHRELAHVDVVHVGRLVRHQIVQCEVRASIGRGHQQEVFSLQQIARLDKKVPHTDVVEGDRELQLVQASNRPVFEVLDHFHRDDQIVPVSLQSPRISNVPHKILYGDAQLVVVEQTLHHLIVGADVKYVHVGPQIWLEHVQRAEIPFALAAARMLLRAAMGWKVLLHDAQKVSLVHVRSSASNGLLDRKTGTS